MSRETLALLAGLSSLMFGILLLIRGLYVVATGAIELGLIEMGVGQCLFVLVSLKVKGQQ